MIKKNNRLTKQADFTRVWKHGRTYYSDFLNIKILKNNLQYQRFAVIVSNKISPKAVIRNKIKRRLREILYLHQEIFPPYSDIVIYAKPAVRNKSYQEIKKNILLHF